MEPQPLTPDAVQVLTEALRLSDTERGDLAARLIDSLDPATEEDVEAAWGVEIQSRLTELQTGQAQPIPWAEARRMILEDRDDTAQP